MIHLNVYIPWMGEKNCIESLLPNADLEAAEDLVRKGIRKGDAFTLFTPDGGRVVIPASLMGKCIFLLTPTIEGGQDASA